MPASAMHSWLPPSRCDTITDANASRYIILSRPRSMSTTLCQLLNAHPRLRCDFELLNPQAYYVNRMLSLSGMAGQLSTHNDLMSNLDEVLHRYWARCPPGTGCGFKVFGGIPIEHLAPPASLRQLFLQPCNVKYILLERNFKAQYRSHMKAISSNNWATSPAVRQVGHVRPISPGERPQADEILAQWTPAVALREHNAWHSSIVAAASANGRPLLRIAAEDLMEMNWARTNGSTMRRVMRFLGVHPLTHAQLQKVETQAECCVRRR